MRSLLATCISVALSTLACASSTGAPATGGAPNDCAQIGPRGERSQMKTEVGASQGPRIDTPKFCSDKTSLGTGAYIRVYGAGKRRFSMGHEPIEAGCVSAPPPNAGPEVCAEVSADAFGMAITKRLKARGIETTGLGLGICGNASSDYDAWNMSISVRDWSAVDATIEAVDEELRLWGVGHFFGVSVRGIDCSIPIEEG